MVRLGSTARGARLIMMGISWMELMVIVAVALIVIGPKDLPGALRALGRSVRAMRRTARQFQNQVDQFVRDSEIDALRRDVEDAVRSEESAPKCAPPRPARETVPTLPPPSAPAPAAAAPATADPMDAVEP